jgi:hypothetical protein
MSARYGGSLNGHDVELEFDTTLQVMNRARLFVDGKQLDSVNVVYGEKDLTATVEDGTKVALRIHSGMVGELTRAQMRQPDGSWSDLSTR